MEPEIRYRLLKLLEKNPNMTQRQMAGEMGLSLGKFNYCLKELVKKGIVKIDRFTTSDNKAGYMYVLTPHGIEEKAKITVSFLRRKMKEYEEIKNQIKELAGEVDQLQTPEGEVK
jgi:EPS-associated MarR family transcriptional regulator